MALTRPTAFLLLALCLPSSSLANHRRENFNASDLPGNHTLQRPSYHTFLTTKEEGVAEKTRETRALRSLRALLVTIVKQELSDCALVLAADQGFLDSRVLANLLRLPNLRQVCGRRREPPDEQNVMI